MTVLAVRPAAVTTPAAPSVSFLPVLLTATFMTAIDAFIVNVALPVMQRDLHAGPAALEWVVAGYVLAVAAGLVTGGRLGDRYGRRRIFGLGLALFTTASVLCGLAPTAGVLVGARVLQGLAAALLMPQVLAIVRTSVAPAEQPKAFARYGLTMGLGAVFGQLIGGLLIRADLWGLDWRLCFLINLPVGVVALALLRRVPESRQPATRLDLPGAVLVSAALVALVLPLVEGREQGWPLWTWLSLAASAPLFALFVATQRRSAQPMVHLALFRERAFSVGLVATQVFWMGQASFFLILALYLQVERGLSALESGVVFTAIGAGYLATSTYAHRIAARLGRQVVTVGALIMVVGLYGMWAAAGHGTGWLVPGLAVDGIGMGIALAPLTTTVLSRVSPRHTGAAAGVLSTVNQTGNAVGVALIGIVFYQAADLTGGFRAGLVALIALELALAAVIQLLPRR
ncbi:MFS transporter [Micromonospora chaiyaphumensis]|uniref:Drug resistance transporter, EmrB/QacA subfamily n=1 Tax=Micromonospora chaiyaphumensis TaxID=307119 RepID=A0A1C4UPZ9_9ACTN|nr:MFS transporter [Micromonospora chaiyaphumensis]SCE73702.1 drug resistance transporter, EmrB/QacA subfamily [Micromonospora chaiyaphumensis]